MHEPFRIERGTHTRRIHLDICIELPGSIGICRIARKRSLAEFELFGPTCDSAECMYGPFLLPADIREGDWVELGQLGAYSACLRTRFNGFDRLSLVEVADQPMLAPPRYAVA